MWATLKEFPPLSEKLGHDIPVYGGWLYACAKAILNEMPGLKLGVAIFSYGNTYEEHEADGIKYYVIPSKSLGKTSRLQISSCRKAIADFQPDLIHIHGTEHSLAQAMCMANEGVVKTVANIQGLAGQYAMFADGGISLKDKLTNITLVDIHCGTSMLLERRRMQKRAECEKYTIRHLTDIIGRTQWDYDHAVTLNPDIRYHFLNESLRDSFYGSSKWSPGSCKPHSIFVSNSMFPLKGAHQMLKALKIILGKYPDTTVNFCGSNVMNNDLRSMLHFHGYHLYLRRLVKKLGLQEHVNFLGTLSESQMKQSFLDANVYVMPSSIENSSNSLCEAQILGVPVIASYCGGTPSLVEDGKTGYLYRYEEYVQLAQLVIRLFDKNDLSELSRREIIAASARHDRKANALQLLDIYNSILSDTI